jgi:hypothetical protein
MEGGGEWLRGEGGLRRSRRQGSRVEEDPRGNGCLREKRPESPSLRARRWEVLFSISEVAVCACDFYGSFEFAFITCCFIGIRNGVVLMELHGF